MTSGRNGVTKGFMATMLIVVIVLIDQVIKFLVKTNMALHECIDITDWFKIYFIENNGMAYGMEFGSKTLLSIFRLVLIAVIILYLRVQVKSAARTGYIVCLALVVAGAIGNLIDCMFYGLMFTSSSEYLASTLVPFGSGYAPFLMGKVVDMFYFPLIVTTWPQWVPLWGGGQFIFFSPVFNFADAAISVGFVLLVLFYHKELSGLSLSELKKSFRDVIK